jgi:hypothetical protein
MKLKNINFGYVLGQSGIQGFFGEGDEYPHHRILKFIFGFSFSGMTFVAKTTSLYHRTFPEKSQTALVDGYKLKEWLPKSIWISAKSIINGYVLNAMGIPSPGTIFLISLNKWQKRTEPFQISFMPMESTLQGKIAEVKQFCEWMLYHLPPQKHHYGVQMNVSCPNTGHAQTEALEEWIALAKVFKILMPDTPLIFKLDILRRADKIVQEEVEAKGKTMKLWQVFAIFTGIQTTGVRGDDRAYGETIAIRAVESEDVMSVNFAHLPYELLEAISIRIVTEVPAVNRVVYDITNKPPGTIEWE